jgi:UPF0755 protein
MSNDDENVVIEKMRENFDYRIKSIEQEISGSERSLSDIIIMASILEEEARLTETRKIVAGILWKRIDEGMMLQVDGPFKYINGKGSKDLTVEDLKIDSPYNTYKYTGLPPTPVSNPGLDSIQSAINPTDTQYYYFLTDDDGNMRYAITHDQHVENKNRYLK